MSKIISFRGTLPIGEQDLIRLKTNTGKTGYKINKFQIITTTPGAGNSELIGQIFKKDQTGSISGTVDFSDSNLLAMCYYQDGVSVDNAQQSTIIFDNEKFNQNIFVSITDTSGGSVPANYYIELETMALSDLESTMLTLKSLRTITS
jgi:hypothetical protein